MRHSHKHPIYSCVSIFLLTASLATHVSAQSTPSNIQMIEPARWTQEDVTIAQKYSTATKESNAALYESIKNCQTLDASTRITCVAQARAIYNEEMADIRIRFKR